MKKLRKSAYDRKLCGVCGGNIGDFWNLIRQSSEWRLLCLHCLAV